ncbi:MAG TPA: hypothetical protein VI299_04035 [Polyangiales bacterium]
MTIETHPNNSQQSRLSNTEMEESGGSASKRRLLAAYRMARPRLEAYAHALRDAWGRRRSLVDQLLGHAPEADKAEPSAAELPRHASNDN